MVQIVEPQWPTMPAMSCYMREGLLPHEPLILPYNDFCWAWADSGGTRMELRVCKWCGCVYYQGWGTEDGKAKGAVGGGGDVRDHPQDGDAGEGP